MRIAAAISSLVLANATDWEKHHLAGDYLIAYS